MVERRDFKKENPSRTFYNVDIGLNPMVEECVTNRAMKRFHPSKKGKNSKNKDVLRLKD